MLEGRGPVRALRRRLRVRRAVLEQRYIEAINGFVRCSNNVGRSLYCTEPGNHDIGCLETLAEPFAGRFRSTECGIMGRVHSSPNLLGIPHPEPAAGNHHPPTLQLPLHSRLVRPSANLQTPRGGQMGRRYCVAVGYPGPGVNGGYAGYGHTDSSGPSGGTYRTSSSTGSAEGEAYPTSPGQQQQQRLGPPVGQLRWE